MSLLSGLTRYDLGGDCDGESGRCRADMVPSKSGEYVDFEDAEEAISVAVNAERERCIAIVRKCLWVEPHAANWIITTIKAGAR